MPFKLGQVGVIVHIAAAGVGNWECAFWNPIEIAPLDFVSVQEVVGKTMEQLLSSCDLREFKNCVMTTALTIWLAGLRRGEGREGEEERREGRESRYYTELKRDV